MKVAKLCIGIVTFVLSLIVLFQSCAASVGSALIENGEDTSGASGVMVGFIMIIAGIVGICARNSKGASIAAAIIYFIAGLLGVTSTGIFADLIVWGVICIIFALVFLISAFVQKYPNKKSGNTQP